MLNGKSAKSDTSLTLGLEISLEGARKLLIRLKNAQQLLMVNVE
jgi:hypothetical protein